LNDIVPVGKVRYIRFSNYNRQLMGEAYASRRCPLLPISSNTMLSFINVPSSLPSGRQILLRGHKLCALGPHAHGNCGRSVPQIVLPSLIGLPHCFISRACDRSRRGGREYRNTECHGGWASGGSPWVRFECR
jgi:hypothetical protein